MMVSATTTRVRAHTADDVNERIRQRLQLSVRHYRYYPHGIEGRLRELDREWDIERALEANAATLALGGVLCSVAGRHRASLALSGTVLAFLLQHAVQGWCPPLPLLRRLGFRTATEIEAERYALKVLRGDFDRVNRDSGTEEMVAALESA